MSITHIPARAPVVDPTRIVTSEWLTWFGELLATAQAAAAAAAAATPTPSTATPGDVFGPIASVNDRVAVFDGPTGKRLRDGGKTIAEIEASAVTTSRTITVSAEPAAPAASSCVLWAQLNAGKVELMVRFPTGVSQSIAIEP